MQKLYQVIAKLNKFAQYIRSGCSRNKQTYARNTCRKIQFQTKNITNSQRFMNLLIKIKDLSLKKFRIRKKI